MKLQTKIPLSKVANPIDYSSQLLLLGSCFAENMGDKLEYFKFQCVQNPFGILFHPLALEKLISRAIAQRKYEADEVFLHNERWHCFDAHSDLSDVSKSKLLEKLNARLKLSFEQITKASHIFLTLGTAWVYRKIETKTVVSNCHKIPQKEFSKELLSIDEIQKSLELSIQKISSINKNVQIIFSVSPIRHLKDGFVENQRSKAHLIAALHNILSIHSTWLKASYFPSYELMMDELRDYRFYKSDMIHPSQAALEYIWEKFELVWLSESSNEIMKQVNEIQKGLAHRPFNPKSQQHQMFLISLEKKITYLQQEYSSIKFDF